MISLRFPLRPIGAVSVAGVTLTMPITIFLVRLLYDRLACCTSSPQTVARQLQAELDGPLPEPA